MTHWIHDAVFYNIYPLGFCGAPKQNDFRLTYRLDSADNLFPSIHCFASWLSWIGVRGDKRVPLKYRCLSLVLALAVCASTLMVKQHVAVDAAAGILLAEVSYLAAGAIVRRRETRRETAEANALL